ncbi:MAG: hypothetical protein LUQ46_01685, partial [Candidatus Methanomethyliaceae archaeon]|nr:hypothetical protein [Candidatus Methanomethyliaceae archaeon]
MCGIFGCLCDGAPQVILDGLKRLEYRGYDSVGIAAISGNKILLEKDKGRIDQFINGLDETRLYGEVGVGHTRWATHGAPCKENAHPHLDCSKTIAVVHNGVLENFLQLREKLVKKGHCFTSNTDTEVIPHMIEEGLKAGLSLKGAVLQATKRIKGSMACIIISTSEPNKLICIRRESPLVIGIGPKGSYCASDIPALLPYTKRVLIMPEDTIAVLERGKVALEQICGGAIEPNFSDVTWDLRMAEKGGYPHFMIKEIYDQPAAIRETLKVPETFLDRAAELLNDKLYLTGSGTSYHACLSSSYMISKLIGIDVRPV